MDRGVTLQMRHVNLVARLVRPRVSRSSASVWKRLDHVWSPPFMRVCNRSGGSNTPSSRGTESSLTLRWRGVDSNFGFLDAFVWHLNAVLPGHGALSGNRWFADSPLEGDGFEPSVPRQNRDYSGGRPRSAPRSAVLTWPDHRRRGASLRCWPLDRISGFPRIRSNYRSDVHPRGPAIQRPKSQYRRHAP
jgi:hypothetical protein